MSTPMTDKTWLELFTFELRARHVTGPAIGDALASVRELLADSGQSAQDAFGPAREYAASLTLPTAPFAARVWGSVFHPVLGIFAFILFSLATSAWVTDAAILLSPLQAHLLAAPVAATVALTFTRPLTNVVRLPWIAVALVLLCGLTGLIATLIAPKTPAEAWLTLSPLLVMIVTAAVLVILSVVSTVQTLRGAATGNDALVDPLAPTIPARKKHARTAFLLVTDWLFPILAVFMFFLTWGLALAR